MKLGGGVLAGDMAAAAPAGKPRHGGDGRAAEGVAFRSFLAGFSAADRAMPREARQEQAAAVLVRDKAEGPIPETPDQSDIGGERLEHGTGGRRPTPSEVRVDEDPRPGATNDQEPVRANPESADTGSAPVIVDAAVPPGLNTGGAVDALRPNPEFPQERFTTVPVIADAGQSVAVAPSSEDRARRVPSLGQLPAHREDGGPDTEAETAKAATPRGPDADPDEMPAVRATVISRETHFVPMRSVAPTAPTVQPRETTSRPSASREKAGPSNHPVEAAQPEAAGEEGGQTSEARPVKSVSTEHFGDRPPDRRVNDTGAAVSGSAAVSVARDATGLPPAALHGIASAILQTADADPLPASSIASVEPAADAGTPGPVRVLAVAIDVPDHGVLNVRMAIQGPEITLHLRTGNDEVTRRLQHDSAALVDVLRDGGYHADIASIATRRPDAPADPRQDSGGQPQAAADRQANTSPGQSGGERRAPPEPPRGEHATTSSRLNAVDVDEAPKPHDRRPDGIYV